MTLWVCHNDTLLCIIFTWLCICANLFTHNPVTQRLFSKALVKTGHKIITLEFDGDRKLMGVIVFSNIGKKSLLVKVNTSHISVCISVTYIYIVYSNGHKMI